MPKNGRMNGIVQKYFFGERLKKIIFFFDGELLLLRLQQGSDPDQ